MKTSGRRLGFTFIIWLLSAAFLFAGHNLATRRLEPAPHESGYTVFSATVLEVLDRNVWSQEIGPEFTITNTLVTFTARVTSGDARGAVITAEHYLDGLMLTAEREVVAGDRVLLFYDDFFGRYTFVDYVRIHHLVGLGLVFFALMVWFGGKKGLNAIVALGFTCMAVFMVLVPAILSGRNIYTTAILVCAYIVVSTLLTVIGPNKKALSAMLGCLGGVLLAGLLMFIMDILMNLTGMVDQDAQFLLALPVETPVSLRAIVFAGVIIGAVGAIMDVAMSIASSLWEVREVAEEAHFAQIFKSGLNIGKDILGTMLNPLILAYIGSSLSLILLIAFYANATSLLELFNREMISIELLRALVGSFGIFLAVPLTSAICGWLYAKPRDPAFDSDW